ncbi:MAG TPA: hypothetical protein VF991_13695 [Reyranella sp.]|jgi:hypothetical protein
MLKRRTVIQASLAGGLLAALAGLAEIGKWRTALGPTDGAGWRPIDWPFPRDGWPPGRAWRQRDGTEVYVRPKLGFCGNCDTGVVTDEEVDRVTDVDLLDERFAPAQEGRRIRITDLFGRARLYRFKLKNGAQQLAEGIAVSYKCDLIVAVVAGNVADEGIRKSAHRFLESNTVQVWLNQQLEGR